MAGRHSASAREAAGRVGAPVVIVGLVGVGAWWRVTDTRAEDFGERMADDAVAIPTTGTSRVAVGLTRGGDPARWVLVKRAPARAVVA